MRKGTGVLHSGSAHRRNIVNGQSLSRVDAWVTRYARALIRYRYAVLLASVVITLLAASGARHLYFLADYRYNFGAENPQLAAFDRIQNTYTKTDNVLFVVAPDDGDVFSEASLRALLWLTEEGWQVPYSNRVDSITNFQHTWADGDELIVDDLVTGEEDLTPERRARAREVALAEPLLAGRLVARDAGATAVMVTVQLPEGGGVEPEITAYAREVIVAFNERFPGFRVGLTGFAPMSNAFNEATQHDLETIVPLMYAVLIVTMFLFLRSLWGTLGTILLAALAAAAAMGLGGWLGIPLTPPAATSPTIILTMAIADSVHILVTLSKGMRDGLAKNDALVEAVRINWAPVFLTSLTTVVGFLSLNYSDAPPFRDLGNLTAIGVAFAWLFSVSFLPAFVAVVPYRVREARETRFSMSRLAEFLVRRRTPVLAVCSAVAVIAATFIPRIELNDMFVSYFAPSIEFRRDTDFSTEVLAGIYQFDYSLGAGEEQGIHEPAYLRKVDEFAEWFREQPYVHHVATITDTMKRLNMNMHADDPAYYRLPDDRELAAQYLLLYEMSLPYGLDLNNQIDVGKSATKLTATVDNIKARELREIDERANAWLVENAPEAMRDAGAGAVLMFAHISKRNIETMTEGTIIAFVLISLILMVSLRSVRLGLISLVPNLVPTVVAFGVWAITVREVGLAAATVTACSLGVVVDFTVHFLSKYLRAQREQGAGAEDAVRYALSTVGSALWVTSLVLIAGFTALALSSFRINSHFGLLVAITIVAALLADFFLLPTLLMAIDRRRGRARS